MFSQICALTVCIKNIAFGSVFQATAQAPEANKALVRRVIEEVWNQGKLDVVDEIYATDYVLHDPANPGIRGPDGYKQLVTMYRTPFPDDHWTVENQIAEGDKVATRWTSTGTHKGEFMGIPPTGDPSQAQEATATGLTIGRIADGKIVEEWANWDALGLLQQLGIIPPMGRTNFTWGKPSEVTGAPGDPETNKALVVRYLEEVWSQGNLDTLDEIYSADVVNHSPIEPNNPVVGIEASKQTLTAYRAAFPDLHFTIDDMFAEGDKVVARWTATGTHQGEFVGIPPTGKQITPTGIVICRIADSVIVETWWAWDALGLMQQLDVIPPIVK